MFYVFYGSDEYTISSAVGSLRDRLAAADEMADLNDTELDGRALTLAELQSVADALPFMGGRRLVVVHDLLGRCNPRSGDSAARKELSSGLTDYLPQMPPTTRLVFVEGPLHKNNPVLRWAQRWLADQPESDEAGLVREFATPKPRALPGWLERQAKRREGELAPGAAVALADALTRDGEVDVRLADSELHKLLTYADGRPVTAEDVELLVTPVSIESIFKLMDALADRDGPTAANLLHQYLDNDEPPLRILALVARQFRLLAQTRALLDAGRAPAELNDRLDVPPFVVRKLARQAQRFSRAYLVTAMRRLRDIDTDLKTGRIDAELALDVFVARVCSEQSATQ